MMKNIVLVFAWWTAKNSEKYCPHICMADCEDPYENFQNNPLAYRNLISEPPNCKPDA